MRILAHIEHNTINTPSGRPTKGGWSYTESVVLNVKLWPRFKTSRWPNYGIKIMYNIIQIPLPVAVQHIYPWQYSSSIRGSSASIRDSTVCLSMTVQFLYPWQFSTSIRDSTLPLSMAVQHLYPWQYSSSIRGSSAPLSGQFSTSIRDSTDGSPWQ